MPISGVTVRIALNLFPNCMENLPAIQRDLIDQAMDYAVAAEQRYVPVDTGSLRDSIHKAMTGAASGIVSAGGGTRRGTGEPIDYAGFQEYGTVYNAPHPFVRPAVADTTGAIPGMAAGMGIESRLIS
jgi:HK97 gp10 family phage protein